jgi:hypothetical protein
MHTIRLVEIYMKPSPAAAKKARALEAEAEALTLSNSSLRDDIASLKQLIDLLVASKAHTGLALGLVACGG